MNIVVGSYEELILGYKLKQNDDVNIIAFL